MQNPKIELIREWAKAPYINGKESRGSFADWVGFVRVLLEEVDRLTLLPDTRERLLIALGYLKGLQGKPLGKGLFDTVERLYVPEGIIEAVEEVLYPKSRSPEKQCPENEMETQNGN